ncbi:MAG: TraR/DksA family transcriptional regulator [Bacteroidales bacterium]|nr:TraR/DksA family transcriptional regulator [Bacteroidales bacterium]
MDKTKKPAATPAAAVEKNRYSAEELQEFKELILDKIATAEHDLELLIHAVAGNDNEANDTAPTFKSVDEGSNVLLKEENQKLAARQQKFIRDLRAALARIENGTYGICQATGKLIPKERLRIVPHATMTVEAKEASKKGR